MKEITPLQKIKLLQSLSEDTLSFLKQKFITHSYTKGEIIHFAADECRGVSFIASGEVVIYQLAPEGRKIVLARLYQGEAFNIVPPLVEKHRNKGSAKAEGDTIIYFLRRSDFLQALAQFPDFSEAILRHFASQINHLTTLVEKIALHSVRARLARFLIDQADGKFTHQRWTQDEIAEQIGTVRDMVGRILRSFAAAGLIEKNRGQLLLLEHEKLENEANS